MLDNRHLALRGETVSAKLFGRQVNRRGIQVSLLFGERDSFLAAFDYLHTVTPRYSDQLRW